MFDRPSKPKIANDLYKVKQVFNDGFSHFVYIIAADRLYKDECQETRLNFSNWSFDVIKKDYSLDCLDLIAISSKFQSANQQIKEVLKQYPDAVFVISLKSGYEIQYKLPDGMPQHYWHNAIEHDEDVRNGFYEMWRLIATELKDIPEENLAFNLLNEPEFNQVSISTRNKLGMWKDWATIAVDKIRSVSPERTVILEGIYKSLFARYGASNILTPIDRQNIIYGFHYYPYEEWSTQDWYKKGVKGVPMPSLAKPKSDMNKLVRYSQTYNVPVVLTEFAIAGTCNGYGPKSKDRATFAKMIYESLLPNDIGITWWSLEGASSPYERIESACYKHFDKQLIPEPYVFKALGLH